MPSTTPSPAQASAPAASSTLHRLLRASFVLALGAVFVLALLPAPDLGKFVSWQDRIEHALLFLVLALWGLAAWPRRTAAVAVGLLAYGVAMEVAQSFTTYRQGDIWDVAADALGVGVGVSVVLALAQRRQRARPARGRA